MVIQMPRKPGQKKGAKGKKRVQRKSSNVPERASLSVTSSLVAQNVNQMYNIMNVQLSQYSRAVNVAKSYQFYRIKSVMVKIKSPYDTYVEGGVGHQKPYLYYMLDKSGSIPLTINLEGLKQMGAKPRVLDEKMLPIKWAPSVLEFAATQVGAGIGLPNRYKISPWLSTNDNAASTLWNASTVDHLGVHYGVFAAATGSPGAITYDLEIEVQFEFKAPLVNSAISDTPSTASVFATANTSVDGIVGGPDGI